MTLVTHTKDRRRMTKRSIDPLKLLLRHEEPARLLTFFRALSEGITAAFADSAVKMPASPKDRPAVYTRGMMRRCFIDRAFKSAAEKAGVVPTNAFTDPPTWSYPTVRLGAFSITVGIVDKVLATGPRRLRSKGKYVRRHARNNEVANPQRNLFKDEAGEIPRVIPNGSLGALIVAEASVYAPDTPLWIGFWLPSPNLKRSYFRCSLDALLAFLREQQLTAARRTRTAMSQPAERKKPVLRPVKKRQPRKE